MTHSELQDYIFDNPPSYKKKFILNFPVLEKLFAKPLYAKRYATRIISQQPYTIGHFFVSIFQAQKLKFNGN